MVGTRLPRVWRVQPKGLLPSDGNAAVFYHWSCQHQAFTLWFGDRVAELPRSFQPQVHGLADVLQRRLLRVAVGRTSRKLGRFSHKKRRLRCSSR